MSREEERKREAIGAWLGISFCLVGRLRPTCASISLSPSNPRAVSAAESVIIAIDSRESPRLVSTHTLRLEMANHDALKSLLEMNSHKTHSLNGGKASS